jgi:hypothetical protein
MYHTGTGGVVEKKVKEIMWKCENVEMWRLIVNGCLLIMWKCENVEM